MFFPFLLSFRFLALYAHRYCLFLLTGTAVGIFKMQRNSAEGRGEVAQAFPLWLTWMRMELHLQQLPSYGSAAAASAPGLVTHSQKLHLQLEHKFCRNSFHMSFSLPKSLYLCVVRSCLGFSRHLESKVNNTSHCSWFRTDNKETKTNKTTAEKQSWKEHYYRVKGFEFLPDLWWFKQKEREELFCTTYNYDYVLRIKLYGWLHLHVNKNDIKQQASEFLPFFSATLPKTLLKVADLQTSCPSWLLTVSLIDNCTYKFRFQSRQKLILFFLQTLSNSSVCYALKETIF